MLTAKNNKFSLGGNHERHQEF